ncbi:hypothetical protein Dimus_037390 [Dionaea muscipula]
MESMRESEEEKSKSDGLEIVSIGSLYSGSWDKKYWSSSRGKDRYPYPVGFHALRTHNGFSYKMEIFEGSKGPIFQITSSDGRFSSGQTPDIAWEKFQRKGCSRIKLGHGKRFSCNIDGVEFFGFRNTLVQRLLRELVANVNAASDGSLLLSDFCKGTSAENSPPKSCAYLDLLHYLEKPQVTRKRSRKPDRLNITSACSEIPGTSHPRLPFETSFSDSKEKEQSGNGDILTTFCTSNKGHMSDDNGTLATELTTEVGKDIPLSYDALPSELDELLEKNEDKHCADKGGILLDCTRRCVAATLVHGNISKEETHATMVFLINYLAGDPYYLTAWQADVNPLLLEDSQIHNHLHLCAPDTFDSLQENSSFVNAMHKSEELPQAKIERDVTHMALSDVPTGALREEESALWNLNDSSENNDFDSVGETHEEIAKSMMSVLLPQALPLLTYSSRKKRHRAKVLQESHHEVKPEDENFGTMPPASAACTGEAELEVTRSSLGPASSVFSIVPDSLENGQWDDPLDNKISLSSPIAEAVEANCRRGKFTPKSTKSLSPSAEEFEKSTSFVFEDQALVPTIEKSMSTSFSNCRSQRQQSNAENDVGCEILGVSHESEKRSTKLCRKNSYDEEVEPGTHERPHIRLDFNDMLEGTSKLIGCYSHPMRISSVALTRKLHDLYACVSCGMLGERERNLFVYKIPIKQSGQGCPSFIGYSSVSLPLLKDTFGNEIAVDKYGLVFTPDAESLVLLDGIKAPHCRSRKYDCRCSSCASYCFEEIAVKIVQVKLGYVSVVVKLKAFHPILCLLVCEPDHLVAVDESGKMYIWVMNPAWSEQTEEHFLPSYDYVASHIMELKRVPKSAVLVLGHNGYGDFSLWDIKKHTILSRFLAPESSVLQFLPVSLFSCQREDVVHDKPDDKDCTNKLMEATNNWLWKHDEHSDLYLKEGEDIAVWLLICSSSDSLAQPGYASSHTQRNALGCWRLALLIKKMVILGTALDPRITAIGISSGLGIAGTCEGLVYMWELSTGTIVGTLHKFEGSGVSDIATTGLAPACIAIAGESGQLLVYLHC